MLFGDIHLFIIKLADKRVNDIRLHVTIPQYLFLLLIVKIRFVCKTVNTKG